MAKKPTSSTDKSKKSPDYRLHEKAVKMTISPEEELKKAFDPMQNRHLWTMWRSAVTGRIVDEVKAFDRNDFSVYPYGKAITQVPLRRLIKFDENTKELADVLMNPARSASGLSESSSGHRRSYEPSNSHGGTSRNGHGILGTSQFVFYGMPRAVLKK